MEKLACITTYFNPVGYRTRTQNFAVFAESLEARGSNFLLWKWLLMTTHSSSPHPRRSFNCGAGAGSG